MAGDGGRGRALRWPATALLLLALPAGAERPETDYQLHCQGCHLADGSGRPGSVPDLRDQLGLFPTVPGGRAFLVQVPGSAQSSLDDASLAALLNWMIDRFGPAGASGRYPPYSAEEVARLRGRPLTDVEPLRSRLLEALAAGERRSAR